MLKQRDPRFYNVDLPEKIDLPELPIGNMLQGAAAKYGDRTALIFHEVSITFKQLYEESLKLANALNTLGYGTGDVISVYLPNSIQYVIAYYGIAMSGATYSAVNPFAHVSDVVYQLKHTETKAVITHTICAQNLVDVVEKIGLRDVIVTGPEEIDGVNGYTDAAKFHPYWHSFNALKNREEAKPLHIEIEPKEHIASIAFTGGTTGYAKGVINTHYNFVSNCLVSSASQGMLPSIDSEGGLTVKAYTDDPKFEEEYAIIPGKSIVMSPAPLYHISGLMGSVGVGTIQGNTLILIDQFHPITFIENIGKYKVTQISGAPSLYNLLLTIPQLYQTDVSSVRNIGSGAAPMSAEIQRRLLEIFPHSIISEGYGLTEATGACIQTVAFKSGVRKLGSIGLPVYNTEVKIVPVDESSLEEVPLGEKGELLIKGPQIAKGYYKAEEDTRSTFVDGWLRTGDVAVRDEDGIITIVDRKKDMLIYNGYNIYPRQIEEIIYQHEAVQSCVIIGIPDDIVGDRMKAFVVLKPNATATVEDVLEYVNSHVVHYSKVREIEQLEQLPMTASGKISRLALQKLITKEGDRI